MTILGAAGYGVARTGSVIDSKSSGFQATLVSTVFETKAFRSANECREGWAAGGKYSLFIDVRSKPTRPLSNLSAGRHARFNVAPCGDGRGTQMARGNSLSLVWWSG